MRTVESEIISASDQIRQIDIDIRAASSYEERMLLLKMKGQLLTEKDKWLQLMISSSDKERVATNNATRALETLSLTDGAAISGLVSVYLLELVVRVSLCP